MIKELEKVRTNASLLDFKQKFRKYTKKLTICRLTATTMSHKYDPPIIHVFTFTTSSVF